MRYHRMRGKNVFYPMGFDDNGLPTERHVEKLHGVNKKKTSRAEFRALCLEETQKGAGRLRGPVARPRACRSIGAYATRPSTPIVGAPVSSLSSTCYQKGRDVSLRTNRCSGIPCLKLRWLRPTSKRSREKANCTTSPSSRRPAKISSSRPLGRSSSPPAWRSTATPTTSGTPTLVGRHRDHAGDRYTRCRSKPMKRCFRTSVPVS